MNKYAISISYAVGILLFFLPFVEVKCNATPLYEAKGIELVTGFTVEEKQTMNGFNNKVTVNDNENERQEGNGFALAAFILGIAGLGLSFLNFKSQPVVSTITGVLAAICMIALMIQVKADVGKWSSKRQPDSNNDLFGDMTRTIQVTADFTPWFYLSLLSFLVAAFLSYRKRQSPMSQQPPRHAPQLSVENPGDQSDFPKSASESDIG